MSRATSARLSFCSTSVTRGAFFACAVLFGCAPSQNTALVEPTEVLTAVEGSAAEEAAPPGERERVEALLTVVTEEGSSDAAAAIDPTESRARPCGELPMGMACVPGGDFWIGADGDEHDCDQPEALRDANAGTGPRHHVWLETFYIDITEVTHEAYQECARSRECEAARPLYRDYNAPTQPMTGMNWFQAQAYCEYRGGRLPTEAEFEAASGGPDGELTPFGNEPVTCENAIIMDERGRACGVPKRGQHPETGRIFEVASRPAGRYGLHDMVGNAEEWVLDWWAPDYGTCGDECLSDAPRGPCAAATSCDGYRRRVVRGGSWYWPANHATSRHRRRYEPDNQPPHHFGFRCVVPLDAVAEP